MLYLVIHLATRIWIRIANVLDSRNGRDDHVVQPAKSSRSHEIVRVDDPMANAWVRQQQRVRDAIARARPRSALAKDAEEDECLYAALVATVPEARGKGYADATLRRSLHRAHEATGFTRTILHATEAGYPVYKRLGYRVAAGFTCYKRAPK